MKDRIGIWKGCFFFVEGRKSESPEKNPQSQDENQRTQPTYDNWSRIRTRVTLVGDERSHLCAILVAKTFSRLSNDLRLCKQKCQSVPFSLFFISPTFPRMSAHRQLFTQLRLQTVLYLTLSSSPVFARQRFHETIERPVLTSPIVAWPP